MPAITDREKRKELYVRLCCGPFCFAGFVGTHEKGHSNADAEGQAAAEIFQLAFTYLVALPQTPAD